VDIESKTYVALSVVMFLEYAIWGAWAPVLAARLLGPLKMSGKQTAWIYATLPIACIFAPFASGWIADRFVNAEWVILVAHAIGAVMLFLAAKQEKFVPLVIIMFCFSLCFAATLPLVNAVLFAATSDPGTQAKVFIWAPVAWALVGWSLTGYRMSRKTQGDGSDCLYLASGLSLVMVLGCVYLAVASPSPPSGEGGAIPVSGMIAVLSEPNFLVFLLVSLVVFGLMQFYFLGTAQFMQDIGIASKHVPGSMALAQIAQALATWFLFGIALDQVGFKWTLIIGATCWALLYGIYVIGKPRGLVIAFQPLHGLAYVFFVIIGQVFTDTVAPEDIRSSMQALIFAATTGVGLFLGTQFAGIVMDAFKQDEKFQWSKVWLVPGAITLAGAIVLVALFQNPPEEDDAAAVQPATPAATQQPG
jgi:nucleoside transporter